MLRLAALLGLLATPWVGATPAPTAPVTIGIFRSGDALNITAADLDFHTAAGGDVHVNGLPLGPVMAMVQAQSTTIAAMSTTITAMQSTMAAMASGGGGNDVAGWDLCTAPYLTSLTSDAMLSTFMAALRRCVTFAGTLKIVGAGVTDSVLLGQALENIQHIGGGLTITGTNLVSLSTAFSSLATVGALLISSNTVLATLGTAFAATRTVGDTVFLDNNAALTSAGTAFGALGSIGGALYFFANAGQTYSSGSTAGSQAFCASFGPVLCPATDNAGSNGMPDDASPCCMAYCGPARANC